MEPPVSPDILDLIVFVGVVMGALFIGIFGYKAIDHWGQNNDWWY